MHDLIVNASGISKQSQSLPELIFPDCYVVGAKRSGCLAAKSNGRTVIAYREALEPSMLLAPAAAASRILRKVLTRATW